MMRAYKIIVSYDGTDFHGWQIQPHNVTIASSLQNSWYRLFKQNITVIGSSRTDAGVHALGQVVRFYASVPNTMSLEELRFAWNNHLPLSIYVRSIEHAPDNFHPCGNVKQKTYLYTLFLKRPLPFIARFGWLYKFIDQVDIPTFEKCLKLYIGTHDFGSFCKIENDDTRKIRTIDDMSMRYVRDWQALVVSIKGPGFARFQIRRMIGYALDVARRPDLSIDYLQNILNHPNPKQILTKAESSGLCLRKVVYRNG